MSAYQQQVNNYLNHHYEGMDQKELILLLFNGALTRLKLTREGIKENNIKKRGENLSKAIAIISELNASVDSKINDESTQFLRGLYASILAELPKISLYNDIEILDKAIGYIAKLKEIWENDVMGKNQSDKQEIDMEEKVKQVFPHAVKKNDPANSFHSISV